MNFKQKILTGIALPVWISFTLINAFAGVVGFVWLACIGQWEPLGLGIIIHLASTLIVALLLLPEIILAAFSMFLWKIGLKFFTVLFAYLGYLTTLAVFVCWGLLTLTVFPKTGSQEAFAPLLLWSYSVATGPWTWMIYKSLNEPDPGLAVLHVWFFSFGYFVVILALFFWGISMQTCVGILTAAMSFPCLIRIMMRQNANNNSPVRDGKEIIEAVSIEEKIVTCTKCGSRNRVFAGDGRHYRCGQCKTPISE